jgi:hypothetical protein
MSGQPTSWRSEDVQGLRFPDSSGVTDEEITCRLHAIEEELASRSVMVDFQPGLPARLAYLLHRDPLPLDSLPIAGGAGFTVLTGCGGDCPGCFQRPWCETGQEVGSEEDHAAGGMALPPEVRPYL